MIEKKYKIVIAVLALILAVLGLLIDGDFDDLPQKVFSSKQSNLSFDIDDATAKVYFFDVGQGDAIFIEAQNGVQILIDGGPDNSILNKLGQTMSFYDDYIDIIILTHPHADHIVGLVEVLNRYKVGVVYYTGVNYSSYELEKFLKVIKNKDINLKVVDKPMDVLTGEELKLQFIYPRESLLNRRLSQVNDSSIVNRLLCHEEVFMFMGDAEAPVEEELLKTGENLSAEVLKLGHHGSASSSTEDFLKKVQPKYAIIMSGENNKFNHPHLSVIKRLERLGIETLRTDMDSDIFFICNEDGIFLVD